MGIGHWGLVASGKRLKKILVINVNLTEFNINFSTISNLQYQSPIPIPQHLDKSELTASAPRGRRAGRCCKGDI